MPEPLAAAGRHRVGGGDERVGAVVDVEHRALGALEQDAAPGAPQLGEAQPDRLGEGEELGRQRGQLAQELGAVDLLDAEAAAQRVVVQQQLVQLGLERRRVGEVADPHRPARHLVLVGRADAAAGGADLAGALVAALAGLLARAVELAVERQDQRRVLGDPQRLDRDRDPLAAQGLDLAQERPGVDHDAVADDRELAAHDAGRQQRELVGPAVDDERVAGVVAALEADHDVGALRQPVHDLALALVAPLGADDRDVRHASSSPGGGRFTRRGVPA